MIENELEDIHKMIEDKASKIEEKLNKIESPHTNGDSNEEEKDEVANNQLIPYEP